MKREKFTVVARSTFDKFSLTAAEFLQARETPVTFVFPKPPFPIPLAESPAEVEKNYTLRWGKYAETINARSVTRRPLPAGFPYYALLGRFR